MKSVKSFLVILLFFIIIILSLPLSLFGSENIKFYLDKHFLDFVKIFVFFILLKTKKTIFHVILYSLDLLYTTYFFFSIKIKKNLI